MDCSFSLRCTTEEFFKLQLEGTFKSERLEDSFILGAQSKFPDTQVTSRNNMTLCHIIAIIHRLDNLRTLSLDFIELNVSIFHSAILVQKPGLKKYNNRKHSFYTEHSYYDLILYYLWSLMLYFIYKGKFKA